MGQALGNLFWLIVTIVVIAAYWKTFVKAGEKGWKAIIPIYNIVILLRIVGKPWWWILLLFIPLVNIVFAVLVLHELSKKFGKGGWFTAGLFFLPVIFVPVLGFGEARYQSTDAVVEENTGSQPV